MDATAWTVIGATITILIALGTSFYRLRTEIHTQSKELHKRIDRIDTKSDNLRERIDAQGQDLRERIDAQGQDLREHLGQLRERMAHLEGLLEGLREAITGKRVA